MEKPPHVRMTLDKRTDQRKSLERLDVVEKIAGKSFGGLRILLSGPIKYFFQIR
jgi:hypothetical protein